MNIHAARDLTDVLLDREAEDQRRLIWSMTPEDNRTYDAAFEAWGHPSQLPPEGDEWRTWLLLAGRGFGKTRSGAEWVTKLASGRPGLRIALVGATIDDARRVMVEGVSGVLNVAALRGHAIKWEPSIGRLRWRNGSEAQVFSGDNPDGLRGPEHDAAWCDELAKWREADAAWMNLEMGLRRGSRPRVLVTTTPRPIEILKTIRDLETTVVTTGRTDDNVNLDPRFAEAMVATYGGTRMGRQELDGELIEEVEGSLWPRALMEGARVAAILPGTGRWQDRSAGLTEGAPSTIHRPVNGPPPRSGEELERIVVGVDPPAGVGSGVDACGTTRRCSSWIRWSPRRSRMHRQTIRPPTPSSAPAT